MTAQDIIDYESGVMDEKRKIKLFRELVRSGHVLEGQYAKDAARLTDEGWL